ncbi:hypothetical protein ACH347_02915 [Saccharopolyspora sp. 5N102]
MAPPTARRLGAPLIIGEFCLDATRPGALDYGLGEHRYSGWR